jgi:hypothetical protein
LQGEKDLGDANAGLLPGVEQRLGHDQIELIEA